jgi:peptidyl-prolyl cis-trans isomerase D
MLQSIGDALKGKKIFAWLILIPLVVVFAIWGATGAVSLDFFGPQNYAAKVNGERIEATEATEAYQRAQSDWQVNFGSEMPPDVRLSTQLEVMERLIRQRLVASRSDQGYRISSNHVEQAIRAEPAFQVGGAYNESLALVRLAQVGLSADTYRADLRRSLQAESLQRTLTSGEFLTNAEIGRLLALESEQRDIRYVTLNADRYRSQVKISETELAAWYSANGQRFATTETAALVYVDVTLADRASSIVVDPVAVRDLYVENKDRYVEPERRRARHILVADEAKAKEILSKLQSGADFAALAKQFSTDTGSAGQGGELGLSDRSAFVAPFAEALFSMQSGELRGPVKTEFGYHLIRLDEIVAGRVRSFEEVRAELETQYRQNAAADSFAELLERIQRRLETPQSDLVKLAGELNLPLQSLAAYQRGGVGTPLAGFAALDAAVFGAEFVKGARISGPIEINEDRFLLVRVVEHRPSVVPPLAQMRARAEEAARNDRAQGLALSAAQKFAETVRVGGDVDDAFRQLGVTPPAARPVSRLDSSLSAELRQSIFAAARPRQGSAPVALAVPLVSGEIAAVVVTRSSLGSPDASPQLRAERINGLRVRQAQSVLSAYVEDMRREADVEINSRVFE